MESVATGHTGQVVLNCPPRMPTRRVLCSKQNRSRGHSQRGEQILLAEVFRLGLRTVCTYLDFRQLHLTLNAFEVH
jgi:hypothetical protein